MKNSTRVIVAALLATGNFALAAAGDNVQTRSETVRFPDLNTDSVQGAAVLYMRIARAADNVCRDPSSAAPVPMRRAYEQCVHSAVGNAIAYINEPVVTAYAAGRGVTVPAGGRDRATVGQVIEK
jgi:UrcA family protein